MTSESYYLSFSAVSQIPFSKLKSTRFSLSEIDHRLRWLYHITDVTNQTNMEKLA